MKKKNNLKNASRIITPRHKYLTDSDKPILETIQFIDKKELYSKNHQNRKFNKGK